MGRQLFTNAKIFTPEGYLYGSLEVMDGRFGRILPAGREESNRKMPSDDSWEDPAEVPEVRIDLKGKKILPGLIDLHIHGAGGGDFSRGDREELEAMAAYLASQGITSFLPTAMTMSFEALEKACRTALDLYESQCFEERKIQTSGDESPRKARILGVRLEGPFLSEEKKGAQDASSLRLPDDEAFRELYEKTKGIIKLIDIAPELPGALDFTGKASRRVKVSAAHTAADYETGLAFYEAGGSQLTHLFNAMTPLHHRSPGIIAAAAEKDQVYAELICDGVHVHPAMIRLAFKLFPERICLISDALKVLGGGTESVPAVYLPDGTLAGSATSLYDDLRNAVRFGIPEESAIRAATIHPAKALGVETEIGSIETGKAADFIICSESLEREAVYISGSHVQRHQPL